jgi:hypothetical protein
MRKFFALGLILVMAAVGGSVWAETATDYIRKRGITKEDVFIEVFRHILNDSRSGQWGKVSDTVSDLSLVFEAYARDFGIDLRPRLKEAVASKDSSETAKVFAHFIFLEMSNNFLAAMGELKNFKMSQSYLARARLYYDFVLAGNIRRRDSSLNDRIMKHFEQAQLALGDPGLPDLARFDPDPQAFESAVNAIETDVLKVYTYFSQ